MLGVDLKSLDQGEADYLKPLVKPGNLRNLRTGRGVRLEDPPERVRRIMGVPTWSGGSLYVDGERVWSYLRLIGSKDDGIAYKALFRFRHGKVTSVESERDTIPG